MGTSCRCTSATSTIGGGGGADGFFLQPAADSIAPAMNSIHGGFKTAKTKERGRLVRVFRRDGFARTRRPGSFLESAVNRIPLAFISFFPGLSITDLVSALPSWARLLIHRIGALVDRHRGNGQF